MGQKVFYKWWLRNKIEPIGELRADYRAAQIVAMVHNSPREAKYQKAVGDFLLKFGARDERKQSVKEQIMILNVLASTLAGS